MCLSQPSRWHGAAAEAHPSEFTVYRCWHCVLVLAVSCRYSPPPPIIAVLLEEAEIMKNPEASQEG